MSSGCEAPFTRTVGLLPGDALDVDHELAAVARLDLALAVLVRPPHDHHLVSLTDGERSDLRRPETEAATPNTEPSEPFRYMGVLDHFTR